MEVHRGDAHVVQCGVKRCPRGGGVVEYRVEFAVLRAPLLSALVLATRVLCGASHGAEALLLFESTGDTVESRGVTDDGCIEGGIVRHDDTTTGRDTVHPFVELFKSRAWVDTLIA